MNIEKYEEVILKTAVYPNKGHSPIYPVLGLCGEAGEVAEKLKKIIRDKQGQISDTDKAELIKELGDVLWYIGALSNELWSSLQEVMNTNAGKLLSRLERNKLHGSGDNR